MTPAMWQALKDYLGQRIDADEAVMVSFRDYPDGGLVSRAHGALVSANRSTLGKMQELEAR